MLLYLDDWSHTVRSIHPRCLISACLWLFLVVTFPNPSFFSSSPKCSFRISAQSFHYDFCTALHHPSGSVEAGRLGGLSCSRQLHKDSFIHGRGRSLANAACVKRVLIARYWCIWLKSLHPHTTLRKCEEFSPRCNSPTDDKAHWCCRYHPSCASTPAAALNTIQVKAKWRVGVK